MEQFLKIVSSQAFPESLENISEGFLIELNGKKERNILKNRWLSIIILEITSHY